MFLKDRTRIFLSGGLIILKLMQGVGRFAMSRLEGLFFQLSSVFAAAVLAGATSGTLYLPLSVRLLWSMFLIIGILVFVLGVWGFFRLKRPWRSWRHMTLGLTIVAAPLVIDTVSCCEPIRLG